MILTFYLIKTLRAHVPIFLFRPHKKDMEGWKKISLILCISSTSLSVMTFSLLAALAFSALVIFWACSSAYTKPENRDYVPNINDKMFVRVLFAHWVLFSSKRLSCSLLRLPLISSRQLLFICNSFLFFTKVIDDVESKGSELHSISSYMNTNKCHLFPMPQGTDNM